MCQWQYVVAVMYKEPIFLFCVVLCHAGLIREEVHWQCFPKSPLVIRSEFCQYLKAVPHGPAFTKAMLEVNF